MGTAIQTLSLGLNPKVIITQEPTADVLIPYASYKTTYCSLKTRYRTWQFPQRVRAKHFLAAQAVSSSAKPDVKDGKVSSRRFDDFAVKTTSTDEDNEIKISVEVSGAKTEAIFDNVFTKMVADAQPIPGFRRAKGGKTPDIPRKILLEILGPAKVYKQVITKVINSTIAEYVEKEGLAVSKDLRVEQSFEDLEAAFEPGDDFRFDAVVTRN